MGIYLHGLHDIGGEHLMVDAPGTIVHAINLRETPYFDYRALASNKYRIICRLNWGWFPEGTIPAPDLYGEMAHRCSDYASNSHGCNIWIIGNEFNHLVERPNNAEIKPEDAAHCHNLCFQAIKQVSPNAEVLMGAIAPWNQTSGDWLEYIRRFSAAVGGNRTGHALHCYTHGSDPNLPFSDALSSQGWYWHLRTYRDQITNLVSGYAPAAHMTFDITESDQGDNAWVNAASGWIPNSLHEIDSHNKIGDGPPIRSISFYRWDGDKYKIKPLDQVQQDFKNGVALLLTSPSDTVSVPETTFLPLVEGGTGQPLPDVVWDPELAKRGVTISKPDLSVDELYWKVIKGEWYSEQEADSLGGDHHIYYNFLNEQGERLTNIPFRVEWENGNKGSDFIADKPLSERFVGNYPMTKSLKEFSTFVLGGDHPSEKVSGIGMGVDGNPSIHTDTELAFQLVRNGKGSTPPIPLAPSEQPQTPDKPDPLPPITDTSEKANFDRVMKFIRKWEGGFQNVENDAGNWTGGKVGLGELKGTNYGISAASYPHLDIKNITQEESDQILYRDYWVPSGASKLSWPGNLIVMDTAVLHGEDTAKAWLTQNGPNPFTFAAKRLDVYPHLENWDFWGRAWVSRVADLLREASQP